MSGKKLCLNMIVKNESHIIERCIKSVYHLIDTWCIVDTGSTDGTQEIIKNLLKDKPGELIERPWVNFGHNRNEALGYAAQWGDWILLTDADMVLVDEGFDKSTLDETIDGFDVIQDNHGTRYYNFRILNAKKDWRCIGVTHEYYSPAAGLQRRGRIENLWFNDISDGGSKGDKFERDIKLLEQGLIDEPENHRYMFYLAQSYRDTRNWEKAIHWYTRCANEDKWDEEAWFADYMVGWCMMHRRDDVKDISSHMLNCWMRRPWRAEPIFNLAMLYKDKQQWYQAYQLLKSCATMPYPKEDVLFVTAATYDWQAMDEFTIAAYWIGNHAESLTAAKQILSEGKIASIHIPRIRKNAWYAEKALGFYSEEKLESRLSQLKEEVTQKYIKNEERSQVSNSLSV
jgi:glycosyltransferase involved in cell wall biosynthesis